MQSNLLIIVTSMHAKFCVQNHFVHISIAKSTVSEFTVFILNGASVIFSFRRQCSTITIESSFKVTKPNNQFLIVSNSWYKLPKWIEYLTRFNVSVRMIYFSRSSFQKQCEIL